VKNRCFSKYFKVFEHLMLSLMTYQCYLVEWKLGLFDSFRFFQCFDKRIPQYYVDSKMYHTYLLNNYKIKFYNFIKYIVMVSCMYELLTYKHQTVSSFVDTGTHTRGGCLWGPNPHDPCKSKQSCRFHFFFLCLCVIEKMVITF